MSAVFYGYRVDKDYFWDFHAALRAAYLAEHWPATVAAKLWPRTSATQAQKLLSRLEEVREQSETELQLFDEGSTYVLRPLEWAGGVFFHTQVERLGQPEVTSVHYDDRSDLSEEGLGHKPTVDWVESQIRRGRYFVVPLVANSDWRALLKAQSPAGLPYDDKIAGERFEELMAGVDRDAPKRPCPRCGSRERTVDAIWVIRCAACDTDLIEAFIQLGEE